MKSLWPLIAFRSGILKLVPDERKIRSLVSAHFKNNFLKESGASEFKDLSVNVAVSSLIRSPIVDQPRSCIIIGAAHK